MAAKNCDSGTRSAGYLTGNLIDLRAALSGSLPQGLINILVPAAEHFLSINKINRIYQSCPADLDAKAFCRFCLTQLGIDYAITEEEMAAIPQNGPLVMMANHPFGGMEGIILAEILLQARPDVRILGNYLLTHIPALAPLIVPVDPINPRKSASANARALKSAMDWVAGGGALLTFPSGEVSHLNLRTGKVADPPWSPHIAKLAMRTKAKVVPVHVRGRNSLLFNAMGLIHPRLRTLLLPRELTNKSGVTVQLTMGRPIHWRKLTDFTTPAEVMNFLRFNTELLKHRKSQSAKWTGLNLPNPAKGRPWKEIIAPVPKDQLLREIEALPESAQLVSQKEYRVYLTTAGHSPSIMREIGRLREISFRDVGEGTGQRMDIDDFDTRYLQLFLWNSETQEIVGAYRIGRSDRILQDKGPSGLYSTTLFNYKPQFYDHLNNSLELGRSFIRTEYQKKFGSLAILWRGIGAFVARNSRYRYLFGPVSISQNYHTISKNLMVAFLRHATMNSKLSPMVKPRKPVKVLKKVSRSAPLDLLEKNAIEEISMLVSEIEQDYKGVPTLIKHYLKLNGQFLAFNLDKDFANVIDGLIWVDLLKTDEKLLERFLGAQGLRDFYACHDPDAATRAA
ncbi:MAG: lysophospholipid acyltransferase family protein [Desulfobacteraceae bacterium]